jgi:murein DD-endopeptidase MepM/ murein hydrolase activator NlpD
MSRLRMVLTVLLVAAVLWAVGVGVLRLVGGPGGGPSVAPEPTPAPSPTAVQRRITVTLDMARRERIVETRCRRGETLSTMLGRQGIGPGLVHDLVEAARPVADLNRVRAEQSFRLVFDEETGELLRLQTALDRRRTLKLVLRREAWSARIEETPTRMETRLAAGSVSTSLWQSAVAAGLPPAVILDVADVFAWQVDFATDIRKEDAFAVIYEVEIFPDGAEEPGTVLAARFVNRGTAFYAFRFAVAEGREDYYNLEGRSVRRAFLKSPLRYRYISSGFSRSRYHPILKKRRPHLGIDYAAPAGTPVSALGDGVVIWKGWKGGFGNYIEIRHNDAYVSCYGHLRGYAKGLRKGKRVAQGEIIGYVGSTGLSTGPHLDFRVRYRGSYVNPLKLKSPPTEPVPEALREEFFALRDRYVKLLDSAGSGA